MIPILDLQNLNKLESSWGRLPLLRVTPDNWAPTAVANFSTFLMDHAACERKASAMAMSFVVKYRDKPDLVEAMVDLAREELEHFDRVCVLLHRRGLQQGPDEKDSYVNELLKHVRSEPQFRLMDKLLLSGIIEARGCERFYLISEALEDVSLKDFYFKLSRAEAKHQILFVQLADKYFPALEVRKRLTELLEIEANIMEALPLTGRLH